MAVQVYIDGEELDTPIGGTYALTGSVGVNLNHPREATINVPMEYSIGGAGSRLKIVIDGALWFHGFVLGCETSMNEDQGYTVYNAQDPMELWQWRPVRADDADFSKPVGGSHDDPPTADLIADYVSAPQILEAMLHNSESNSGPHGGVPPEDAEGPLFLDFGDFDTGGYSMDGAPVDWPMTIMEFTQILMSTGRLDVILTPIDYDGLMAKVDAYNGNYGTNRTSSVVFSYGMGAHNIRAMRWNQDMSGMCNKLWYFFGPKMKHWNDPAAEQHWCFNITGDDPGLTSYPSRGPVLALREDSQEAHGVRMEIQIFDGVSEDCDDASAAIALQRELWRGMWLWEQGLRSVPRTLVHITPVRGSGMLGTFGVGDIVRVQASAAVRGGFDQGQRVYGYTVSWDNDGVLELSEIMTSADQEGAVRS